MADFPAAEAALIGAGGALVGVLGKGALDWLLAIGKVRADREARAEARRDKRLERRDDFQRQTLLDLQDAVEAVGQAAAREREFVSRMHDGGVPWREFTVPPEIVEALRSTLARLRLARSRTACDHLRQLARDFAYATQSQSVVESPELVIKAYVAALKASIEILDVAGQTIRDMDEVL